MPNYYDSGWFYFENPNTWIPYTKDHNLGARPRKIQVFTASDEQGTHCCRAFSLFYSHALDPANPIPCGYWIEEITTSQLKFRPALRGHYDGTNWLNAGYARILCWA